MILTCGTCGHSIRDTPEENVDHFERGQDSGYGICTSCGGFNHISRSGGKTPNYLAMTEKQFRKQMGYNYCMFLDARINLVRENLSRGSVKKFDQMQYQLKCNVITQFLEKGVIKW